MAIASPEPVILSRSPSCAVLTRFDEIRAIAPAWDELLARSNVPEAMLSAEWMLTWWQHYGQATGRELRVVVFFEDGRLAGLAPLQARRFRHRPGIPFRRLEPLGADVDEGDGVCSEYLNLLCLPGQEELTANAFAEAATEGRFGPWHEFVLPNMDGAGPMPELLAQAFKRKGFAAEITKTSEAPYLVLPASWDLVLGRLPSRKRRVLSKHIRDFEQWSQGTAKFHEVRSLDELEQGWKILVELHQQRWQAAAQPGAFASARFCAFHRAFIEHLLQQKKLELLWLEAHGEPIAAMYNFFTDTKTYFYQSGRKMDLPERIHAGTIMMIHAIQNAIRRGAREFDFLGGPSQFKLQFTDTTRPLVQLRVARRGMREWLRCGAERSLSWARAVKSFITAKNRKQ